MTMQYLGVDAQGSQGLTGGDGPIGATGPVASVAFQALTEAAGLIPTNCANGTRFKVTLNADATLSNPTNPVDGTLYFWMVLQGASNWTLAFGNKFNLGTFTAQPPNGPGSVLIISAVYEAATTTYWLLSSSNG